MEPENGEDRDLVSWGWSEYFTQLERFFRDLERQFGIARVSYAKYATERLEVCEVTLNRLLGLVYQRAATINDSIVQRGVVLTDKLLELRRLILALRAQWQQYSCTIEIISEQTSYHVSVAGTSGRRGQPNL